MTTSSHTDVLVVGAGPTGLTLACDLRRRDVVVRLVDRLQDTGRRRPVVEIPLPGSVPAALRAGANLAPGNRAGGTTWREFLAGRTGSQFLKG